MNRTITVTGTGRVSLKADTTVVSMTLKTADPDYDISMTQSTELLSQLRKAISGIGFKEEELKTISFNVCAEYESVCDQNGNYRSVFVGYACIHGLQLEFDFDTERLSKVLHAISLCVADPELNIRFTVKDKDQANDKLLQSAAASAKHKAEILAAASGVSLGQLISVDYSWGEHPVYSHTEYVMEAKHVAPPCGASIDFCPEDIDLQDSATFIWEIQ